MRELIGGADYVEVEGATLGEALRNADREHNGIWARLTEGDTKLAAGYAAVCGSYPAQYGLRQALEPDMEVHFVPPISGG